MLTGRFGQFTLNSSVKVVIGRWTTSDASDRDFPSLEPYWSRPDTGSQRPVMPDDFTLVK